jgi:hypothetical protein
MAKDKQRIVLLSNTAGQVLDLILCPLGATLRYLENGITVLWQNITPAHASRLCPEARSYYSAIPGPAAGAFPPNRRKPVPACGRPWGSGASQELAAPMRFPPFQSGGR